MNNLKKQLVNQKKNFKRLKQCFNLEQIVFRFLFQVREMKNTNVQIVNQKNKEFKNIVGCFRNKNYK